MCRIDREKIPDLVDEYLEYLFDIRGYSERTVGTYDAVLNQMQKHCEYISEGEDLIIDIRPLRFLIIKNSKKTIAKKLSAIRSFVSYLKTQKGISVSLKGDTSVKVPRTLPKPIENELITEVMEDADLTQRTILAILYGMGLRISELSTLERENISGKWITVKGKGGKTRQLPLIDSVKVLIDHYISEYPAGRYLFEKGGVPMNASQLRYIVGKIFKKHGIKATPHQLRHSFASHLLNNGARISDVSELLGHSSMSTTQIYTKLSSNKKLMEYVKAHPLAQND